MYVPAAGGRVFDETLFRQGWPMGTAQACFRLQFRSRFSSNRTQRLQFPSRPIRFGEECIRFREIGHLRFMGIICDRLTYSIRNIAQQHHLRKWTGVLEIASRTAPGLAGFNPLPMMTWRFR